MSLERTGFSDVLPALRHVLDGVASPSDGEIITAAIEEIERLRGLFGKNPGIRDTPSPWDTTVYQKLRAMPSSLNDACRTMEAAADEIDRLRTVTDEMADRALNAWFASPPSEADMGLMRSMRAALEAALKFY